MCVKVICYPAKAWTPKLLLRFVTITLLLRNYVTLRSGPAAYYGSAPTHRSARLPATKHTQLVDCARWCSQDEELEMLVILRMNRDFMRLMRMYHPEVAFQQFGQTVVEMDASDTTSTIEL